MKGFPTQQQSNINLITIKTTTTSSGAILVVVVN